MALQWISAAWKTHLKTVSPVTDRVYIDFRQIDYPAVAGAPTYTALVSGTQWSGYSNMTGSYAAYLLSMPTKLVLDIRAVATFAFNTASDQPLASWYYDANTYLTILYRAADDKIVAKWKNGGTERELATAALDGATLPAVTRVTLVFDSTTGSTAGSALYIDAVLADDTWSGNADARTTRLPKFEIRAANATAGDWKVNTVRLFQGITATATDVSNHFKSIKYEETYWPLNSCSLGMTRCNVTRFVKSAYAERNSEDMDTGGRGGNRIGVDLYSLNGEFADDQYAAFAPESNVFNGTATQAYMKQRARVLHETWYGNNFEPLFFGRVEGGFSRSSAPSDVSMVGIGAVDQTADLALRRLRRGRFYTDKYLTSATEADSLVHLITRLGTQREIYNYLANSGFENATIANSWTASGGTLTRQADPLLGTYCGQLANASGSEKTVTQIVTFTGNKALNVGETWTFSVWLKSAGAAANDMTLQERDSGGTNGTTTTAYSLAGGDGWVRYDATRTITDATSDRLAVQIEVANGVTLKFDCAMLTQSGRAYEWFVLNDNDGSSGTESADDVDLGTYDTCGFDVDVVTIQHPWVRLAAGDSPWDAIKQMADATIAYQCGFSEAGVFQFKAILGDSYSDPASSETLTAPMSIGASPVAQRANKIVVRGAYFKTATSQQMVWIASQSGSFALVDGTRLSESVTDGSTWPPPATFGRFIARWDKGIEDTWSANWDLPGNVLAGPSRSTGGNVLQGVGRAVGANTEIVGVIGAQVSQSLEGGGKFTVTTLDTTTWADGAELLLTNGLGATKVVKDCGIIGKPVYRTSGRSGFVHDSFVDWDRVEREGENTFELSNDYIVTKDQVEQLADWHHKYNAGSIKHIYNFSQAGTWHWLVPGQTYTLTVGGAGQEEYISATARLVSVRTERGASELGRTMLVFRELLQAWVFDSNAVARFVAGQDYSRLSGLRELVVAASDYVGRADYFCDGTADQTEINAAITALSDGGRGVVRVAGNFTLSDSIVLKTGVILSGTGDGSVITSSADSVIMVTAAGTAGARDLVGAGVRDLVFDGDYPTRSQVTAIEASETTGFIVENVLVQDCDDAGIVDGLINITDSTGPQVRGCRFDGGNGTCVRYQVVSSGVITGITISGAWYGLTGVYPSNITGGVVSDVTIADVVVEYGFCGILIGLGSGCSVTGCEVSNVLVHTIYVGTLAVYAIQILADDSVVDANTVAGMQNFHSFPAVGIYNDGARNHVQNNTVRNVTNLMLNGNCEDDTPVPYLTGETDDNNVDCTFARSADFAHRGTYSYKFTKTIAAGTSASTGFHTHSPAASGAAGMVAGCTYILRLWVYVPTASGITATEVRIFVDDDVGATAITNAVAIYDAWQQLEVTYTFDPAKTGERLAVGAESTAALNEYFYVDDIELIPVGVHNEHGQAWLDGGTETRVADNSWSQPFNA